MVVNAFLAALFNSIIDLHDSCLVTTSVAVIWGWKDSDNLSIMLPLVSLHHQLMGTGDEVQPIDVSKLLSNVLSERIPSSPRWDTPTTPFERSTGKVRKQHTSKPRHGSSQLTGHLDPTKPGHTSVPREALLELYQGRVRDQEYQ